MVQGTVRIGRNSIHPVRDIIERIQEKGHDAELFDAADYDTPLLERVRYQPGDSHPDIDTFGWKVELADARRYQTRREVGS